MHTKARVALLWGLALCLALVFVPWAAQASVFDQKESAAALNKIDSELLKTIQAEGQADFFIWLAEQADVSGAYQLQTKLEKGQYVFDTLRETADLNQRDLRAYLDAQGVAYRPFYVANTILVYDGSQNLLMDLAARPDVDRILPNREYQLQEPFDQRDAPASPAVVEPNISFIRATDVWAMGITGQGTVMAGGDTGMQWNHPALINHYRGWDGANADHNYNWWDATNTYPLVPTDGHGHGTHISGTMVGDDGGSNQIGVAPGAQVIHCKNMTDGGSGNDGTFITCFEWVLAPWDLSGQNPMPSLAPDAMNNSWGYFGGGAPQFITIIENLHAAGILVEVSAGNEGPGCGTLRSPGDYDFVLSTGSVNHAGGVLPGTLTGFSSRGPSSLFPNAYIPTIMAPGENIRSSLPGNTYASWSGTSMAGPHAAALVGLMWSANPGLAGMVEETMDIIRDTAVPLTGVGGSNCGGDYTTGPNNDWGFGTIDALAAVQAAMLFGGTGTLEGTVTDATTTNPLEGVEIVASLTPTMTWTANTDADGFYSRMVFSGTFTVTASLFAYLPQTVTDVQVTEEMTTTLDFQLQPAESYVVSGQVTDATTGWPLYAQIEIQGSPHTIWTDPADGTYSVSLPAGIEYEFVVDAWVGGYNTAMRTVGPLTGDVTEDFGLEADLLSCSAPGYSFDYLYYENFIADDGGYTIEGPAPAPWQWGTPVTWPGECVDGPNCWGTNLTGNYNNNANQSIVSPVIDLSAVSPGEDLVTRWWQAWHIESATWDKAYAEVSIDGGAWQIMWEHTGGTIQVPWTEMSYDLSAAAGSDVQFRFRFTSDSSVNFNGYYIDAIGIVAGEDCQPQAGGLVVGNVYDENMADPLVGALVAGDSGEATVAVATPADPNVDDAFYIIFAPAGSNVLTATMAGGYGPDTAMLTINDGETINQHFWLPAGWLIPDPAIVEVAIEVGTSYAFPVDLSNLGSVAADYDLYINLLSEDFEGSFPPDDWTVVDNGGDCVWQRNDDWPRANYAGGDGFSAAADSDHCGNGTTMNTELQTPVIDLSAATQATLDFVASYRHLGSSSFQVHVSDDGGSSWDTLLSWTTSVDPLGPGMPVSLDLTPYVGSDNVLVSFHYTAPGWDWWAQVDQIRLLADSASWLSVSPESGSVAPGESDTITFAIDASNLTMSGTYTGSVLLANNTPYGSQTIRVLLTLVDTAEYGLDMAPDSAAASGAPGETVMYTLVLTNTGNVIDTYTISATGHSWDIDQPGTVPPLNPGESAEITISVMIPPNAAHNATDTATITVTSDGDPSVTMSMTITTTSEWDFTFLYLPFITRP
jgi:subtilisin family serine protease